jgi:VCBS repeat-containing protein
VISAYGVVVTLLADGSFRYDPRTSPQLQALPADLTIGDTFTYRITDGTAFSTYATVTVEVTGVNDAPVAINDAVVPPTPTVNVKVLENDSDIDGSLDASTVTIVTPPANGTAVVLADGSITYTIRPGFGGTDLFTYTVRDNSGALSNVATVSIEYNSPPIAVDDSVELNRNTSKTINVLANDSDVDGTLMPSTVTIVSAADFGALIVNADGTVTYTPVSGYVGRDSFTYTVRDNDGAISNEATVDILVTADPHPWRNPVRPLDVNADGFVSPLDALIIINDLNFRGSRKLPNPPVPPFVPPPYLDTNGDGFVSASDALLIINYLNTRGDGEGEGEGEDEGEGFVQPTLSGVGTDGGWLTAAGLSSTRVASSQSTASRRVGSTAAATTGSADGDYALSIGEADAARHLALRDFLATSDDEDVLDMLAADVANGWDDDVSEHVAIRELLAGRRTR